MVFLQKHKKMNNNLVELKVKLHIDKVPEGLLNQALTHPSFVNETPETNLSYQRLEFLGDSVLSLLASEYIFLTFTEIDEGLLTDIRAALVRTETLAKISRRLGIGKYIHLSKGEMSNEGYENEKILADVLEAIIAAVYLNSGYEYAKNFFLLHVASELDSIMKNKLYVDPKTTFQEFAQAHYKRTPRYDLLAYDEIKKNFTVGLYLGSKLISKGQGKSKKSAQQEAAKKALADN
ncbi:MAG: ribonuclease III [Candidatus Roizmanbacteria bacterium]|nr:ribonuclease III [Candidatus Roizmanbacteria bacterium]